MKKKAAKPRKPKPNGHADLPASTVQSVLEQVAAGVPFEVACNANGVFDLSWAAGEDHRQELAKARAVCERLCIENLKLGSGTGWQRWQWLLMQLSPTRWGSGDINLDELDEGRWVAYLQEMVRIGNVRGFTTTAKAIGLR